MVLGHFSRNVKTSIPFIAKNFMAKYLLIIYYLITINVTTLKSN